MNRDLACFVPLLGDYEGRKATRALRDFASSRARTRQLLADKKLAHPVGELDGVDAEVRAVLSMRAGRLMAGVRR